MKRHSALALVILIFIMGCNRPSPPKELLDELIRKQRNEHVGVGWIDRQKLDLIVFGARPVIHEYTLSAEEAERIETESLELVKPADIRSGTDAQRSPDGKWITYRTSENNFVLADASGRVQRTLVAGAGILTPLYWSPDSEYLMYVEKGGAADAACLHYMEDSRYVVVYRLRDSQQGQVYQVCQGYPYTRFGWLRVPSSLLLPKQGPPLS